MEPSHAVALARQLMLMHGLQHWTFHFNRRKRSLGLCRHDVRRIELSHHFVLANEEPDVRDTILHEIAHALAGRNVVHGPMWQDICRRIGAIPERCCRHVTMPLGKWRGHCPTCGKSYSRHRRPQRNRLYMCRSCGPTRGPIHFQRIAS